MTTPDPESRFVERVLETIARYDLLPRGRRPVPQRDPVVVGVSGGPDSVALARVLARLAGEGRLAVAPILAHLHHGLRDDTADADQVFVENLAAALGLPLEVGRADVPAEADAEGIGVEEAGRGARRRFLAEVARQRRGRTVALGHHADDRVETVLFHILRGTGIDGLAALGPRGPLVPDEAIEIVRPLMHPRIGREEVVAYLRHVGQAWREDETNRDLAHARNRLRHEVVPMLARTVNPAVGQAIFRLADQAEAARAVLADALEAVWREIVREVPVSGAFSGVEKVPDTFSPDEARRVGALHPPSVDGPSRGYDGGCGAPTLQARPRSVVIDADDFALLRPWLQGAILRRAVQRLGGGLKHMSAARTEEVVAALLASTVAGPVDLPDGLVAQRRRRVIRIGPRREEGDT